MSQTTAIILSAALLSTLRDGVQNNGLDPHDIEDVVEYAGCTEAEARMFSESVQAAETAQKDKTRKPTVESDEMKASRNTETLVYRVAAGQMPVDEFADLRGDGFNSASRERLVAFFAAGTPAPPTPPEAFEIAVQRLELEKGPMLKVRIPGQKGRGLSLSPHQEVVALVVLNNLEFCEEDFADYAQAFSGFLPIAGKDPRYVTAVHRALNAETPDEVKAPANADTSDN